MSSAALPAPGARVHSAGPSGPMRLLTMLFWFALPVVGLFGVVMGLSTIADKVDDKPAGIPGTYVVTSRSCSGGICLPAGTFTSADGVLVRPGLAGVFSWAVGSTHKVVFDPSSTSTILPLPGHWDAAGQVAAVTGGVGLLLVWGWSLRGARRRVPGHDLDAGHEAAAGPASHTGPGTAGPWDARPHLA